jgi:hypothetical protein
LKTAALFGFGKKRPRHFPKQAKTESKAEGTHRDFNQRIKYRMMKSKGPEDGRKV